MSRKARSLRLSAAFAVVAGGAVGLSLLLGSSAAPAATPLAAAHVTAGHKCVTMTGSGDPAFVRSFNPYTNTGLPSGQFVKGAFYEGLIISPEGGKPAVPWLARSWKWSNGNKTLTLSLAQNVKFSDGTPMTSADVVYSLKGGNSAAQQKVMDIIGHG